MSTAPTCRRCGAPRVDAPDCPRCGVIYAKAEVHAAGAGSADVAPDPGSPASWKGEAIDAAREVRLRAVAIPAALLVACLAVSTNVGQFFVRTFASMWVHEIGHAAAAWLCGYPAFPGPWFTPIARSRSVMFALALAIALGYGALR